MVPSKHRRYWTTKTTTCSSSSCWPMTAEDFLTQAKITSLTYECYSETLTITTRCSWTLRTLSVSWKTRQTLWCIRLVKHIRYSKWPQSNLVDNITKYEISSHPYKRLKNSATFRCWIFVRIKFTIGIFTGFRRSFHPSDNHILVSLKVEKTVDVSTVSISNVQWWWTVIW